MSEMTAGSGADVIVCGHTHMQCDRTLPGVRVVHPGSVGMPYGERGAFWASIGPDVDFRRTTYDCDTAAARIRQSSWPEAAAFARDNVLAVPSAEQAMEFFSKNGGP